MKILILSLADNAYREIERISTPNKEAYAKKHGYEFRLIRVSLDRTRHPSWSKILALYGYLMEPDYDWIFWSDPDSLIVNDEIKLEDIIDDRYDLIFGEDDNGINCGEFLIKNSDLSREFLADVYQQKQFKDHIWLEQAAVHFLQPKYQANIKLISANLINSHPEWGSHQYKEGDFIIHFSGLGDRRLAAMRQFVEEHQ